MSDIKLGLILANKMGKSRKNTELDKRMQPIVALLTQKFQKSSVKVFLTTSLLEKVPFPCFD